MKFLTSFYWQEQENAASLTLQQIRLKNDKAGLLLACVCDSRDFCSNLVDWFHEEILRNYGKRGNIDWDMVFTKLRKMAAEEASSNMGTGLTCAGILCVGAEFVLFGQGEQRVYLLNRGFRGNHVKMLMGNDKSEFQAEDEKVKVLELHQGIMEPDVSILLATTPFFTYLTQQMLSDCLGGDIRDEKQASLHLKELGEFGRGRGEQNLGAVFIRTQAG